MCEGNWYQIFPSRLVHCLRSGLIHQSGKWSLGLGRISFEEVCFSFVKSHLLRLRKWFPRTALAFHPLLHSHQRRFEPLPESVEPVSGVF